MNKQVRPAIFVCATMAAFIFAAGLIYGQKSIDDTTPALPTGTYTQVKAGPADIYPKVPGTINPNISQNTISETICNPKWSTSSERPPSSYTTALKVKQIQQYALSDTRTADYEEDHIISLELGGNPTDPNNLWPEPYTASIADGGAKTKDQVENYLHAQVCAGRMTLLEAQESIADDWYLVYVNNLKGKYSSVEPYVDEDDD